MSEFDRGILSTIEPGVEPIYPDFANGTEQWADFAADPEGPIGLAPDKLGASVAVDAKVGMMGSTGSVCNVTSPMGRFSNRRRANRTGVNPDNIVVRVGVRTLLGVRTPEEIESTAVHELVHVRQIRNKERSMRVGRIVVGASSFLGWTAPAIEGTMRKDFEPLLTLLHSAGGLALGKGIGSWLAPHEREARKVARETPYMGIVTGTRSADYPETIREKIRRKHTSSESKVTSLFWGTLDKITARM